MKLHLNLFKERHDLVGLAIGDAQIRALQLTGTLSQARVEAFAEDVLPKATLDAEGKVDVAGLARVLENLFLKPKFGKFSSKDIAVNLPESRCFIRVIHMSSMSDTEIDAAVPFEAESYIPIPIDQVYLDWQRLEEVNGRVALLLVASPKIFVDQILAAIKQANLVPVAVEVESGALARALLPPEKSNVLIADMKASATDLIIIEKGDVQFTSTVPIAGTQITDAIAKGLDLPAKRAEEIKIEAGFGNTEEYPNLKTLLVPILSSLVAEIKQVMVFHDQHSAEKITKVVLVGGSARLKFLPEFLEGALKEYTDLRVELGDPTSNVHVLLPPDLSDGAVLAYTAAIGLAMRGLRP